MQANSRIFARKRAIQILYSADICNRSINELLKEEEHDLPSYTIELLKGIEKNQTIIDETIKKHLLNWSYDRVTAVDKAILKIGTYEILFSNNNIPKPVVLSQAADLANEFSIEKSANFVSGVLGGIKS